MSRLVHVPILIRHDKFTITDLSWSSFRGVREVGKHPAKASKNVLRLGSLAVVEISVLAESESLQ